MPFETFLGSVKVKVTLECYIIWLGRAITPTLCMDFGIISLMCSP